MVFDLFFNFFFFIEVDCIADELGTNWFPVFQARSFQNGDRTQLSQCAFNFESYFCCLDLAKR